MLVLWQGWEEGAESLAIGQLTQALKLDTGTVTPLLKRMEAKGLLTRSRSVVDERIVLVSLSSAGKEMREKASEIPQALACQSGVAEQKIVELRQQLQAFTEQLA
jgi:DNA-binding MarR family transcriptional regulator